MPYRRLPNTDSARLKAMSTALKKGEGVAPMNLAFQVSTFQEIKYFLPEFKQAVQVQKEAYERQVDKSGQHQEALRKARLYISHFIQVMNFSIARGELKENTRKYFNLEDFDKKLPSLNSEKEVIDWGVKLIKGEERRMMEGLTPITNPNIARVKVKYEEFIRTHNSQKSLQDSNIKAQTKTQELRDKADRLILKLWNEVEDHFSDLSPAEKRKKCNDFGVIYVFRKQELLSFENLKLDNVS